MLFGNVLIASPGISVLGWTWKHLLKQRAGSRAEMLPTLHRCFSSPNCPKNQASRAEVDSTGPLKSEPLPFGRLFSLGLMFCSVPLPPPPDPGKERAEFLPELHEADL